MITQLQLKQGTLDLSVPHVMGVLNVTPDSFSDGGKFVGVDAALAQAETMIDAGATFIDVGGESTRPGAEPVSVQEELDRVLPVVEKLQPVDGIMISIDTSTPEVMLEVAKLGADLINDVRALQREGALEAAVQTQLPVCLMHMQGAPKTMQAAPSYNAVVQEVKTFLSSRKQACVDAGISAGKILLDPGFGFGKTVAHNYQLLNQLGELLTLGSPLLVGMSRKSMLDAVLHKAPEKRVFGGITTSIWSVQQGASIIRTHDVEATVDALQILNAIKEFDQ